VREAWPSPATGRVLEYGDLKATQHLELVAESELLVAFGDGIEHDRLSIAWGQHLTVGTAASRLALVTG
jgi:hypothetical protein